MKFFVAVITILFFTQANGLGQSAREAIYSDFVLYNKRKLLETDLWDNIIARSFSLPLDSNTEYRYESACRAITQFMLSNDLVTEGFGRLFSQYDSLQYETKKAFLEAVYGIAPGGYSNNMQQLLLTETNPLLFAMAAVYLYRQDSSVNSVNTIRIRMVEQFPGYDTLDILTTLDKYLDNARSFRSLSDADIKAFFQHQRITGKKTIYSFQRRNRDYPGLAIVQNADGGFVRHPDGRIMVFEQLARSASDLPWFIKNGNTPQGVYSIQGTAVANNKLIGPTPNLQLVLPFEKSWEKYFQLPEGMLWDSTHDALWAYRQLLPPSLRDHPGMTGAYYAGKIGRNAIIAHGTTIDPAYFKGKPFYPLTPTQGCLCAKELWNVSNGRLLVSEQFNMVSAFRATPGNKGYLYVIDVDDQQKPVSRAEVERWVR